jgi:hypothetical protein
MVKLCEPKEERGQLIRESHTFKVIGNFDVRKSVDNLKRYIYWPKMNEEVACLIVGCIPCCTYIYRNKNQ